MTYDRPNVEIFYDMKDLRKNGPLWKVGDWIIIEHLTMEDMQLLGENPESDGVVRLSLAGDETGQNRRKLIEVPLDYEDRDFIQAAITRLTKFGEGFKFASALKREEVNMSIRPPQIPLAISKKGAG